MRSVVLALLALLALPACLTDDDDGGGGGGGCDESGAGWDAGWATLECAVFRSINARRAEGGDCGTYGQFGPSAPLALDPQLRRAARRHRQDMATRNYFSHDSVGGPDGASLQERLATAGFVGWSMIGENIAAGQATAEEVMAGWMDSDGHCSNILEPDYTLVGVGYAFDAASTFGSYWTQDFGTK